MQCTRDTILSGSDYSSALGQAITFGTLQTAPKVRIEEIQRDLFNMFTTLKGLLRVL